MWVRVVVHQPGLDLSGDVCSTLEQSKHKTKGLQVSVPPILDPDQSHPPKGNWVFNKRSKPANKWNEAAEKAVTVIKSKFKNLIFKIIFWKEEDIEDTNLENQ